MTINVFSDFKIGNMPFIPQQKNEAKIPVKRNNNIKNGADTVATGLWLTAVGFAIYKTGMFRKKSPEYLLDKASSIQRKYSRLENITNINDNTNINKLLENQNKHKAFFIKNIYKLGENFFNLKAKMGDELYNNMINSFGKLFIMPIVILANPFGKKETTGKEKTSLIIREPLSILATFTLQGAFDKIFDVYMPKILESNMFEIDAIKNEFKDTGKVSVKNYQNLKYNPKEAKRLFIELADIDIAAGGLKGIISKENAERLVKLDAFEPENYDSYIRNFEKLIKEGITEEKHINKLKNAFKTVTDCIGNYEIAKVKPKIAMNILVVVILSRIFLNVIHGKSVKLLHLNEDRGKNG